MHLQLFCESILSAVGTTNNWQHPKLSTSMTLHIYYYNICGSYSVFKVHESWFVIVPILRIRAQIYAHMHAWCTMSYEQSGQTVKETKHCTNHAETDFHGRQWEGVYTHGTASDDPCRDFSGEPWELIM